LSTARLARAAGADVILTGRNPERLERAAAEVGAARTAAFDASDHAAMAEFLGDLDPVDHLISTAGGPYYAPLAEIDIDEARRSPDDHRFLAINVAQRATGVVRGSLTFISGTGGRKRGEGLSVIGAVTAAMPALIANLAVEAAPIRVNLIAPGFVDTP